MRIRRGILYTRWLGRWLWQRRAFFLRGLLCLLLAVFFLITDERTSYDLRFQIRGSQSTDPRVILVVFEPSDVLSHHRVTTNQLANLKEVLDVTDSFFWHPPTWEQLFKKILAGRPAGIGVSLFFPSSLGPLKLTEDQKKLFFDPRVTWASGGRSENPFSLPLMANDGETNLGLFELPRDEDGVIRKFYPATGTQVHLTEKLTKTRILRPEIINFRGPHGVFREFTVSEILAGQVDPIIFKDAYILVGSRSPITLQYSTPLGLMHRTEVLAQITDNLLQNRWILRAPEWIYISGLLLLTLLAMLILSQYPQTIAFVLILLAGTTVSALSVWIFDSLYFWTPVYSSLILLGSLWMVLTGYQANKVERLNLQLKQEQKYLQELEQLKNNFVSLISHDLKTPIAKIQAVVDRLINTHGTETINADLRSLQSSSDELNRYIQSILKVLRVESRDLKINKEVSDINDLILDVLNQLRPLAKEKNVSLKEDLEPLFSVEIDTTLIREVLVNLIDNGIKYTPAGGQVTVVSREVEDQIMVEVQDTGEGISPDDIHRIWDKFVRGKDQDLKTKGSGLGLYLVKYFIELHGGEISLESIPKKGTTFRFTLPIESPEQE